MGKLMLVRRLKTGFFQARYLGIFQTDRFVVVISLLLVMCVCVCAHMTETHE